MPDQAKNMLIGLFVVAACAIIVFVLMFLHPSVGDEKKFLHVRFANIDKITLGTRVSFAGKPIGEVVAITELPDVETERKTVNGYVYVYELTLRVDSGINVFNTDEISSRTSGLLGEKSVAIIPGSLKEGQELHLVNNEVLYATETGSVEDTLKALRGIGDKVEITLESVKNALDKLDKAEFWENLGSTASNLNDITAALNNPKVLKEAIANMHKFTVDLTTISGRVEKGEGSIGKFLAKDDLYLRTTALLSKANTTLNDVNHYGFLYHTDKGWQRLRARRMNLLQKLSSPQEFRNYFNDEVDQVHTSLERVSMVLEQMEGQPAWACYDLMSSGEFTKVYAELLRQLSDLEEEVRMYNQQVMDTAAQKNELIDYCR